MAHMRTRQFRVRGLVLTLLAALALLVAMAGCGDEVQPTESTATATETSGGGESMGGASQTVNFTTADDMMLSGRVFGSGKTGVVLAHMYPADQTSWFPTAEELAASGYLVLTFDFRGYGDSTGSKDIELIDLDVEAAVSEIEARGAQTVGLVGASMGGTACLVVAARLPVAAVATLSAPVEFRGLSVADAISAVRAPKIFIAAEDDVGAEGARKLFQAAVEPKEIDVVPGSDHGTNLLTGSSGIEVHEVLLSFLKENLPIVP